MIRTGIEIRIAIATGQASHREGWLLVRTGVRPMLQVALGQKVWAHLPTQRKLQAIGNPSRDLQEWRSCG